MLADFYSNCINSSIDAKFIERFERIQCHILPNHLSSNAVAAAIQSPIAPLSPVQRVDPVEIKQAIKPVQYKEFKDSFPFSVKMSLLETVHNLREKNILSNPSIQSKLMVSIVKTVMFDLYNQRLSKFFRQPAVPQFARPLCAAAKALYTRHSLFTMMECNSILGRQDIDIIHGDKTGQLLRLAKFIVANAPSQSFNIQTPNQDPTSFLTNFDNLVKLFEMRDIKKSNELKQMIAKAGQHVFSNENQMIAAINENSNFAVKAAIAHMESSMLKETSNNQQNSVIRQIILLDSLVKIQDDLGWIVANHLISEEMAMELPFIISELIISLAPHTLILVDSFEVNRK
ncbi:hypothetical protein PPL_00728 [Heterostelium album PN500]|uniref:Acyl-CoA oxidase C-terminal domain-containing protein n=1 Tax=Heterostelium pallidum (strain ATCC 26659 / Pp 5 / PN500) TaxID=670386 RepID=D3AX97_HETP5|nr:hypothetical protein PPL_00728 [Heterostelium album PN500]EFA86166.1 hypothetical protein PPL_00728 [Heterostelium album PN500]|eukprot:XP_020438271.1 hypothetical protein PPL_00728 [Heterostelium album PN500]